MRTAAYLVGFLALTTAVSAQPNPFKLPKSNLKARVLYQLSGDQKGTAEHAFDGDRTMTRTEGTIRMMGKDHEASSWTMITADSMYTADLDKKEGTASANLLPHFATAYDGLDGAAKQRFYANIKEMGALMSKAFVINSFSSLGETLGTETIAGEVCENRKFASFTICSMKKYPTLSLKTSGDLLCFRFEQTATSVTLSSPPSSSWEIPAGVKFAPLPMEADSAARGFVGYLASQQLADSLAKAKMEIAQAKPDPVTGDKPREMTKEEKDQMRQACDMIKNFDLGKALAGAWDQMKRELGNAVVESAKQGAMGKLRGLIKKPRIP